MAPGPLRKLVGSVALFAAIAIAISSPVGYVIDRILDDTKALAFKADLSAERVAKYIYTHGQMWQYQTLRIAELISLPADARIRQSVFDRNGRLVYADDLIIPSPALRARAPIIVAGTQVGEIEAAGSLLPALADAGLVAMASWLLALLAYFAVRLFPIRALDQALGELAVQNDRFEAALDNMTQGLCMLDAGHRIAVLNRRFEEMFCIEGRKALIGATPERLVEAVVEAGILARPLCATLLLFPHTAGMSAESFSRELPDGRTITVSCQAVDSGGWVATFEDISERRKAEAQLDYMVLHDALTNLPNRVLFRLHLKRELAAIVRGGHLAVLCLNLDRFKSVNDTLGHPVGDALLQTVATRLNSCLRESDIVARLGGDEFAIIQSRVEQPTHATALARRLVEFIGEPYELNGQQVIVGVSLGIAVAPADGVSPDDIMKNADLALCRAKAEGRGTYRFFESAMDADMQARRSLEIDLRRALAEGELELYFQPLIAMSTGRVRSFEALLRWRHPTRGIILPAEFVPLAEEVGLIIPIGEWVLQEACVQAATWPEDIKVAVNFSPVQFKTPNLVGTVKQALQCSGLAARRLDIEITESVVMQDSQATLATLQTLRDLGVSISMDDFGTGYSSLSYLRSFPFDKIKIDKCFVQDLGIQDGSVAIIRAVVSLGRALGMSVTAEGIETEHQLALIKAEGCAEGQGFLLSPPCPANEVAGLLARLHLAAPTTQAAPTEIAA